MKIHTNFCAKHLPNFLDSEILSEKNSIFHQVDLIKITTVLISNNKKILEASEAFSLH